MTVSYAGITIGPIFDTISRATVPAALWFSSILFSDLTRRLCRGITEDIPGAKIFSPGYDPAAAEENDGAGVYHDRIVFSAELGCEELRERLAAVVSRARRETADRFPEDYGREELRRFLESYLEIHYAVLPEARITSSNSVQAFSPILDALELMKTFPSGSENDPFARLFANDGSLPGESRNEAIRRSSLFPKRNRRYLLNRDGAVRSIGEIAANGGDRRLKNYHYFAVVNADGDNMGRFLADLSDEDVTAFSGACMKYAGEACDLIADFGGMPIYAGGDDLLFLSPIFGRLAGETAAVTDLCRAIGESFSRRVLEAFGGDRGLCFPTLSFGVSVQYKKFPLYEALEQGRALLEKAKGGSFRDEAGNALKDSIALNLRKHSGQSLGFLIRNPDHAVFRELVRNAAGDSAAPANAVLYTVGVFEPLLRLLFREYRSRGAGDADSLRGQFLKVWGNLFDNPEQGLSAKYAERLGGSFFDAFIEGDAGILPLDDGDNADSDDGAAALRALRSLLGWAKFLRERAGEDE